MQLYAAFSFIFVLKKMQSQVEFQKRLTFVHLTVMGVSPSAVQTSLI